MNRILHGFLSFCVVGFVCTFITTGNAIAACSATQYEGYNGVCVECDDNNGWYDNYTESCGNGTLTCKNFAYKVRYFGTNEIVCMPCPGIKRNSTDIWTYGGYYTGSSGVHSSHYNNKLSTWSGTSRCTLVVSQPDDGTGCEKNIKFTPSSACLTYYYSDLPLPDAGTDVNPDFAEGQCDYDIAIQYKNASAGYRLTSTSYGNSCTKCGEHEYSPGGNITSCSQCPYYSANPPSPWGPTGWSGCEPIIAGFDSNQTLATQGIGNGNNCTVGTSTSSNSYGDFVAGACNASGSDFTNIYRLYIAVNSPYCPYTGDEWISRVCLNGMHCSSNACGSCASSLVDGVTPDGRIYITRYNLYDAQILLSQIASATSLGCLESCYID